MRWGSKPRQYMYKNKIWIAGISKILKFWINLQRKSGKATSKNKIFWIVTTQSFKNKDIHQFCLILENIVLAKWEKIWMELDAFSRMWRWRQHEPRISWNCSELQKEAPARITWYVGFHLMRTCWGKRMDGRMEPPEAPKFNVVNELCMLCCWWNESFNSRFELGTVFWCEDKQPWKNATNLCCAEGRYCLRA